MIRSGEDYDYEVKAFRTRHKMHRFGKKLMREGGHEPALSNNGARCARNVESQGRMELVE